MAEVDLEICTARVDGLCFVNVFNGRGIHYEMVRDWQEGKITREQIVEACRAAWNGPPNADGGTLMLAEFARAKRH